MVVSTEETFFVIFDFRCVWCFVDFFLVLSIVYYFLGLYRFCLWLSLVFFVYVSFFLGRVGIECDEDKSGD